MTTMPTIDIFIFVMGLFSAFMLPFIDLVQAARDKVRPSESDRPIRLTAREIFGAIVVDLFVCGVAVVFMLLGSNPAASLVAPLFVFCFCLGIAGGVVFSRRTP